MCKSVKILNINLRNALKCYLNKNVQHKITNDSKSVSCAELYPRNNNNKQINIASCTPSQADLPRDSATEAKIQKTQVNFPLPNGFNGFSAQYCNNPPHLCKASKKTNNNRKNLVQI